MLSILSESSLFSSMSCLLSLPLKFFSRTLEDKRPTVCLHLKDSYSVPTVQLCKCYPVLTCWALQKWQASWRTKTDWDAVPVGWWSTGLKDYIRQRWAEGCATPGPAGWRWKFRRCPASISTGPLQMRDAQKHIWIDLNVRQGKAACFSRNLTFLKSGFLFSWVVPVWDLDIKI